MKWPNDKIAPDESLDDLLSLRGKPFADWKEERKYLREKWGEQGKKVELTDKDNPPGEESEKMEEEQS